MPWCVCFWTVYRLFFRCQWKRQAVILGIDPGKAGGEGRRFRSYMIASIPPSLTDLNLNNLMSLAWQTKCIVPNSPYRCVAPWLKNTPCEDLMVHLEKVWQWDCRGPEKAGDDSNYEKSNRACAAKWNGMGLNHYLSLQ